MASSWSTSNRWLSNILRPRASSITVESCLNIETSDPTCPLDARQIIPLVSSNQQPLATRCKHLRAFTELCKSYKFTHLDNVFFVVNDILDQQEHQPQQPQQQHHHQHHHGANQDARHTVFEFMIAAIEGQYDELGMARVTFYSSLRDYKNWDDFADMYRVLFALCKGGRDISGFEKNVGKLLIQWLKQVALKDVKDDTLLSLVTTTTEDSNEVVPATVVPFLSDIMHLLTVIAKFNFAMFEENEVTDMIKAARLALFSSSHPNDIKACLAFADVVVRYRFVPFEALQPFMDILCVSVMLPQDRTPPADKGESPWSIFMNLLRSHCAHNAILTLCNAITNTQQEKAIHSTQGAITLLTQAAWGNNRSTVSESYQVPDSIVLMYLRRAALLRQSEVVSAKILECLKNLIQNQSTISLLEWDTIWDICDICTEQLLKQIQNGNNGNNHQEELQRVISWFPALYMDNGTGTTMAHQFIRFMAYVYTQYAQHKSYSGPVSRLMKVIYALRHHISPEAANILLTYYEKEHMLLPSDDDWLERLTDVTNTFFIPSHIAGTVRLRVLSIVTDVCMSTKDFYSDEMNSQIIYPMVQSTSQETNPELRQKTVDLIVLALSDAQENEVMFDRLLDILRRCASCKCLDDLRSPQTLLPPTSGVVASTIATATTAASTSATIGIREDERSRTATLRRSQSQSNHPSTSSPRIHYTMPKSSTASPLSASSPVISDGSITSEGHCCSGVPAMYGLVQLFEELLVGSDSKPCLKVFRTITSIGNNMDDLLCPYGGSKVVALDMLLRLRCPPDHRVYLIDDPFETDTGLMATIRQTQTAKRREAMNRDNHTAMMMGSAPSQRHHLHHQQQQHQQDQQQKARYPSPVVLSHSDNQEHHVQSQVLPIDELMDAYIVILSHSSNWELIQFVLKRLPLQLANKHMFCGASATIEKLRRRVVTWVSNRDFLKSVHSIPSNIKRNDVYVYAYNILVVLVSYRRLFSKQHQDEIVYAFYKGLTQVTAATKPCIHALSVCCHELPLSVTKMLNEILQHMSKIISVSSVSVHILEFLSTLARLPGLYANFTSDMYKPVFAIALNYLQHTQTSSSSSAASSPMSTPPTPHHHHHPQQTPPTASQQQQHQQNTKNKDQHQITTQNALSQYVLIMAYLVITVWFTAVPLRERRKHVSFIIGRLLSATPIGKSIDEQTFTCIDMLSRFSFADVSLSPEKSLVSKILMGDPAPGPSPMTGGNIAGGGEGGPRQTIRTWVYGHTLLTLKTAKALGWIEMTIRRPSGTVSMMCNIENRIKSSTIDYQTLPALLMMQYTPDLMASRMLQQRESGNGSTGDGDTSPLPLMESGLGITFENLAGAANIATQQQQQQQQQPQPQDSEQPAADEERDEENDNDSTLASGSAEGASNSGGSGSGTVSSGGQTPMTSTRQERLDSVIRQVLADPETPAQPVTSSGLLRRMDQPLDPGFLFLQLSNYPDLTRVGENIPALPEDEATARSLGILDRIPVVDFHKIGVLYVGKNQSTEVEILANTHGSPDYVKLLNALGDIELLKGRTDNTGGLDREMDIDGRYAYFWKDDVTHVIFHVATLMPTNLERDPQCSNKKRHIGNDFVTIVYNDSGKDYAFDTLPGQFNFCNIVITPHSISSFTSSSSSPPSTSLSQMSDSDNNTFFKVQMQRRPDMPEIGPISEPKLVSGQSLPHLVRQTALHANIFAQVFQSVSAGGGRHEYVSPWKERLRQIKRIRERVGGRSNDPQQQQAPPSSSSSTPTISVNNRMPFEQILDFTKYT
ncbi:hypothetical protein BDA99DRAFT_576018 [Phascolomyces articulosus]|uniref:Rap-GAP domain-containing protein n=1 Tax=Phascolomyces articulosus TaxID=60185 RepID=A0AAD5PAC2_9FUNG|nr:hypothetical protein BDA99DRAFT_576018 [Phascolomyces articulosus]